MQRATFPQTADARSLTSFRVNQGCTAYYAEHALRGVRAYQVNSVINMRYLVRGLVLLSPHCVQHP